MLSHIDKWKMSMHTELDIVICKYEVSAPKLLSCHSFQLQNILFKLAAWMLSVSTPRAQKMLGKSELSPQVSALSVHRRHVILQGTVQGIQTQRCRHNRGPTENFVPGSRPIRFSIIRFLCVFVCLQKRINWTEEKMWRSFFLYKGPNKKKQTNEHKGPKEKNILSPKKGSKGESCHPTHHHPGVPPGSFGLFDVVMWLAHVVMSRHQQLILRGAWSCHTKVVNFPETIDQ